MKALGKIFGSVMSIALLSISVVQVKAEASVEFKSNHRTSTVFNADWRFKLGKTEGAEAVDFDDAAWDRVGLPHSFSMPYFRAPAFYTGDGWYRKTFVMPEMPSDCRLSLEFEGAFQDTKIFVNGKELAHHRGGYTGFPVDISTAVHPGRNVIAVRVNNEWQPTLAPRAGEHVFSGGIYRDVWLTISNTVHVPWNGTRVTTPELSEKSGKVAVDTEVRNDGSDAADVVVSSIIVDDHGWKVATLADQQVNAQPGSTVIAKQLSATLKNPKLWSPETPVLYRVITSLKVAGKERDRYETSFGFRWFEWTADRGFFLNGKHRYFRGANVHQDQAGWGDAVTNRAIERDVQMIKDAGFDFIRGSHYPHDPHFAESTDKIGMLFLSEAPFWGTASFKNPWGSSAYPTEPAHRRDFDASVKQQLAEMIRINRNHPSIIAWGMDNEVFFSARETMPEVRRLLKELVALSHELDPTRPAAIDGAQRGEIDKLGDIAGYNGDGASLFPNPGIPNFVAEYGITMTERPGNYEPGWDDLPNTRGADPKVEGSWRLPWRSGEAIWAGFDHGSIAGKRFGGMGMIDYFRLPKRQYYWYRNAYAHVPPPVWPESGTPAALQLKTSAPTITRADGTDDVQVIVSVVDSKGHRISNNVPIHLAIESGPGEFPTGRTIDFAEDSDIIIRDGEAAISLRSWQAGVTSLRATSPGLKDAIVSVQTIQGPAYAEGKTPVVANRPYTAFVSPLVERPGDGKFGLSNPTFASSNSPDHSSKLANDGDANTYWQAESADVEMSLTVDLERIIEVHQLTLSFPQALPYGFVAEIEDRNGRWSKLVEQIEGQDATKTRTVETESLEGRLVRIRLRPPVGSIIGIAEIQVRGALKTN